MTLARWTLVLLPLCLAACSGSTEPSPDAGTAGSGGQTSAGGSAGQAGAAGSAGAPAAGGSSGTAGSAGQAGASAAPQCTEASQCTLHDDCCNCLALGPGEQPPPCNIPECFASSCASMGPPGLACSAGQCVFALSCDVSTVTCKKAPPACPQGEVPTVEDKCYSGGCSKPAECLNVAGCTDCLPGVQVCAVYTTQLGIEYHCVDVLPACEGKSTCECMGPAVCVSPYDTCSQVKAELNCSCPAC